MKNASVKNTLRGSSDEQKCEKDSTEILENGISFISSTPTCACLTVATPYGYQVDGPQRLSVVAMLTPCRQRKRIWRSDPLQQLYRHPQLQLTLAPKKRRKPVRTADHDGVTGEDALIGPLMGNLVLTRTKPLSN